MGIASTYLESINFACILNISPSAGILDYHNQQNVERSIPWKKNQNKIALPMKIPKTSNFEFRKVTKLK